ncbi:MAG: histidine kinase [Roseburia sp.]|nr:histidine kinase [Roseburia sp.]
MKKFKGFKSSFLYRYMIYFVVMIIIPIICTWWLYEKVLNLYYTENTLATQQINLENSLTLLESSLNATANAFVALGGNQEVSYYVEYRPNKSNMMYGTYRRVSDFCEELHVMTPYLTSLKIYCDSPLPIYAYPFVRMEKLTMEEEFMSKLEDASMGEIVWRIVDSDSEDFPEIFAYKKLYAENYLKCIGYMEIQLSSHLLSDYFEMVSSLSDDARSVLTLYHGDTPIYSSSAEESEPISYEDIESGYESLLAENQYRNYLKIPELNLCLIRSGHLLDVNVLHSSNIPSVLISVILMLLLLLFIAFFMNIVSLSKRILAFSSFIRYSNPEKLSPFHPEGKAVRSADELDVLIDTYNTLIQENNSLISQIQKMELFTQDARFQALQGQIHPHFIYGTLETIRMTALQNKDKEAASMIFSLSSLIRYSMSISSKAVTLKDELEIARHYLTIQKMRFDERIDYAFHVDEKLLEMEIPSFILQPILENAIVYGVSQTLDKCTLTVNAYEEETHIGIVVSNTGLPITKQRLQEVNELLSGEVSVEDFKGKRNGLALNNIKERLVIFFGDRASIRLVLQDECTSTVITIEKK